MIRGRACNQDTRSTFDDERDHLRTRALMRSALSEDPHRRGNPACSSPADEYRVLLVQRRTIELQNMAEMLQILGYRVTKVSECGKALLYFGREPCRLLICDLDMPHINGFQLACHIRKYSPQTCILLMTASCQAEVVDYMDAGVVDGWLFKPFRMGELHSMLKTWSDNRSRQK
jgi:DNA-binding response OmpR family regulator